MFPLEQEVIIGAKQSISIACIAVCKLNLQLYPMGPMNTTFPFDIIWENIVPISTALIILLCSLFLINHYLGKPFVDAVGKQNASDSNESYYQDLLAQMNNDKRDILSGTTPQYEWNQIETELEMLIELDNSAHPTVKARDISAQITRNSIKISLRGNLLVEGEFCAPIRVDDSCWQLDEDKGKYSILVSLMKDAATSDGKHWPAVLKADCPSTPVSVLDANDPQALKDAIRKVSKR